MTRPTRPDEAGDYTEQGRFAAAGRTEQADEFAIVDGERHAIERDVASARRFKGFANVGDA